MKRYAIDGARFYIRQPLTIAILGQRSRGLIPAGSDYLELLKPKVN